MIDTSTILTRKVIDPSIILTRKVDETIDIKLLLTIRALLKTQEKEVKELDYLQVFELNKNNLIQTQEVPPIIQKYTVNWTLKEKIILWAIKEGNNWIIMYPEEY